MGAIDYLPFKGDGASVSVVNIYRPAPKRWLWITRLLRLFR